MSLSGKNSSEQKPKLDDVDVLLAKQEGKIVRPPGTLCRHGDRQKCTNCLPLDPYDEDYLQEKGIKHLSFHAYVRKLTDLHGKGTKLNQPLENIVCKLRENCPGGHQPYPRGICAKCRPSTLTLNRQVFRHVDNITIENPDVVDSFLNFWRRSSCQRIGFLIGRYELYAEVPLGIRATVCAVYEPPQVSDERHVQLPQMRQAGTDDNSVSGTVGGVCELASGEELAIVDSLCSWLGLCRVGWIFTDLWSADTKTGTVHCIRNEESFLLSASECITAGHFQLQHLNPTTFCSDGYFGSKFVTVVASGDSSQQIHFSGYQVSNQCTAMVEADILCPTRSYPELAWVREQPRSPDHYITDVQYKEKNEYGLEVLRNGRPMPVEYLLVDVPTASPIQPVATFTVPSPSTGGFGFPVENRSTIGEPQALKSVARYVHQFGGLLQLSSDGGSSTTANNGGPSTSSSSTGTSVEETAAHKQFLALASNFHFLLFLLRNDVVHFSEDEVRPLAEAVAGRDADAALNWAHSSTNWATLCELLRCCLD